MAGDWIEDFNRYVGIVGDTIETIQGVLAPTPQTTTDQTPANEPTKPATVSTDTATPASLSPLLLVGLGLLVLLFLKD